MATSWARVIVRSLNGRWVVSIVELIAIFNPARYTARQPN
jgi:hypothetical protein